MPDDAPAPTERGWVGVIVALLLFLVLPPWLRWVAPVTSSLLLLLPALGAPPMTEEQLAARRRGDDDDDDED